VTLPAPLNTGSFRATFVSWASALAETFHILDLHKKGTALGGRKTCRGSRALVRP
jgi:hypothetical protein